VQEMLERSNKLESNVTKPNRRAELLQQGQRRQVVAACALFQDGTLRFLPEEQEKRTLFFKNIIMVVSN
jgi:hypothetical protein